MMIKRSFRIFLGMGLFLLLLIFGFPRGALAADTVRLTSCTLVSESRLQVTASCSEQTPGAKEYYLFALGYSDTKLPANAKPLAFAAASPVMRFTVNAAAADMRRYLYSRFVIGAKQGEGYRLVSGGRYISNPGRLARYSYRFPKAGSKKGLQVSEAMLEDAQELNIQQSVLNINLSDLIAPPGADNRRSSIPYSYNGKTYWFSRGVVNFYDRQLKALKQNGAVVTAVLLLGYRSDLTWLITPGARSKGHAYYAWNVTESASRQMFQAASSFLAERYAAGKAKYGRIANWVLGNEVDMAATWNYSGNVGLSAYMRNYARAFRILYNSVASVYSNARVYISLTHLWNTKQPGCFTARETLEAFAAAISQEGYIPWNIAYHPYSSPLTEPKYWENRNRQLTAALTTPVINMGNLSVLTSYVKRTYGSSTRIILSEVGFTSRRNGRNVEREQSAAIAYGYLTAEADDMVDAFVIHRHVDNTVEKAQGLDLGLWTTSRLEWADKRKQSWKMLKYMDTSLSETVTRSALPVVGAKSWKQIVPGYGRGLYAKFQVMKGKLRRVGTYQKRASIAKRWKLYGAAVSLRRGKEELTLLHDAQRNFNSHWGFTQKFSGLSFEENPVFCTALKVTGTGKKVRIKLRFYSGKQRFECSKVIPAGQDVRLGVSLAKWNGRKKVTRIQILAEPVHAGWSPDASFILREAVRGR